MRLRLENGEIVTLDDSLVGLSEFLVTIRRDAAPLASLESIIKCGPHKKSCTAFMKALTGALQKQGAAELSEDHIRQLGNPDSALCQAVCSEFGTEPELLNCLEYVHMNVDTLLNPVVHRIAFLKDPQLLLALEFLKIRCSRRGNDMFKDLPFALQGWDARKNMRTLVHSDLVPYVEFIEHLDDTALVDLAKTASQLKIHALEVLIGCFMARLIIESDVNAVRRRFPLPDKFRDASRQRLDALLEQKAWHGSDPYPLPPPPPSQPANDADL